MTIAQLVYASKPSTSSRVNVEEILVTARARNKFDPYEMDHRSAIEFLSEVAGGTGERQIAAKKDAAT
jgi:hypothetical protein